MTTATAPTAPTAPIVPGIKVHLIQLPEGDWPPVQFEGRSIAGLSAGITNSTGPGDRGSHVTGQVFFHPNGSKTIIELGTPVVYEEWNRREPPDPTRPNAPRRNLTQFEIHTPDGKVYRGFPDETLGGFGIIMSVMGNAIADMDVSDLMDRARTRAAAQKAVAAKKKADSAADPATLAFDDGL